MRLARYAFAAFLMAVLVTGGLSFAKRQTKPADPADKAAVDDEPVISRVRLQQIKGCTFFYVETETTINNIGPAVAQIWMSLDEQIKSGKIRPAGGPINVYHGVTQDRDKPFKLEVGFPVEEGTKPEGDDFKVRKLEDMKAATTIFSGKIMQIGNAYQQLFTELFTMGLQPTGETREMYLHWEAPNSPNNIVWVMAGVK